MEFLDGMPARQFRKGRNERRGASPSTRSTFGRRIKHSGSGKPGGKDLNRMVSGLARCDGFRRLLDVESATKRKGRSCTVRSIASVLCPRPAEPNLHIPMTCCKRVWRYARNLP